MLFQTNYTAAFGVADNSPCALQTSKLKAGTQLYIPGTAAEPPEGAEVKDVVPAKILVTVGNTHRRLKKSQNGTEEWTAFVRHANGVADPSSAMGIKQVTFTLHPDFEPNTVTVNSAPFEVTKVGWGVFDVGVEIQFKDGTAPRSLSHTLVFEERPSFSVVPLN
jgi:transcription initiation factor IIF auxiliary subunit